MTVRIGAAVPFKQLIVGTAFCWNTHTMPPAWFIKVDRFSYRREDERAAWPVRNENDSTFPRIKVADG